MVIISLMILIIAIALTPSHTANHTISIASASAPSSTLSYYPSAASILKIGAGKAEDTAMGVTGADDNSGSGEKNLKTGGLSPLLITRLTSIIFLFSGALSYNAFYIQSIGSGLSLYSGLFQVTALSQSFDLFVFLLASVILLP